MRAVEYVNEITEYAAGEGLTMRSVKAPFPMTVAYAFEDAPGGTLVRIRAQGGATGFYAIAGPLLGAMVRRGIARDLAKLKSILE